MTAMIEKITITLVEGDYPFKVFRGNMVVKGLEVKFEGVVYLSVGSPNVRSQIDPADVEKLKQAGFSEKDVEELELNLQHKILNGEVSLEQKR